MYNNIIVTESYTNMRAMARKVLSGKWMIFSFGMFIFMLLSALIPSFLGRIIHVFDASIYIESQDEYYEYSRFPFLYMLAIQGPFTLGFSMFVLNFIRTAKTAYDLFFCGFERFFKAFTLFLLMNVFAFLWSMLFFIPGVIAYFRYSLAFYILADNPELSAMECLRCSKIMMRGNKGYLFGLNLSFIGWALLAILAVVLMTDTVILFAPYVNIYITSIMQIFLLIPTYILMSYINTANGLFYEIVSGHLRQIDNQMY
jgi:hypothetical protein